MSVRVYHRDLMVRPKMCSRGSREFCARHGIDWAAFVRDGIDSSDLEHIDDEMVKEIIRRAEERDKREKEGS